MDQEQNPWDILSQNVFDSPLKRSIDPRAADNVLIAWPGIINLITNKFRPTPKVKVLDYGCGSGDFCRRIAEFGYSVIGIDSSTGMIECARRNSLSGVRYLVGDASIFKRSDKFDVVTAIMVFPFVSDLNNMIGKLSKLLNPCGLLIVASFNPAWVSACLKAGVSFADFDSVDDPRMGQKIFGEIKVPVFIRTEDEFNRITGNYDLENIYCDYPAFTDEFNKQFPDGRPKEVSEYLIIGYQKLGEA